MSAKGGSTVPLLATYLQNSAAYSDSQRMQSDWKVTVFSTRSRRIEDSLLRNAPWEDVGSTSERYYSRRK